MSVSTYSQKAYENTLSTLSACRRAVYEVICEHEGLLGEDLLPYLLQKEVYRKKQSQKMKQKGMSLIYSDYSGRITELIKLGIVERKGKNQCATTNEAGRLYPISLPIDFEPKEESREEKRTSPEVVPSASTASDCPQPSVLFIHCECGKGAYGKLGIDNKSYVGKCRCGRQIIRKV